MNLFDHCFHSDILALLSHDLSSLDNNLTTCPDCQL